jgi:mRNA interferase MazF
MKVSKRGEIWLVKLDPTRGQEIQKTCPAVIVSSNFLSDIQMRIVVPVATWHPKFAYRPFMVPILKTDDNGLDVDLAGNVLQIRNVSVERLVRYLGVVSDEVIRDLLDALMLCLDYEVS